MPANTNPIFPVAPKVVFTTIQNANTAKDGTGVIATGFTAGANGSRVDAIKIVPMGTNVASVLRVFINNGATNATGTNNTLYHEISIPATTLNEAAGQSAIVVKFDGNEREVLSLPAGYKFNLTLGTALAAGLSVTTIGGDY